MISPPAEKTGSICEMIIRVEIRSPIEIRITLIILS